MAVKAEIIEERLGKLEWISLIIAVVLTVFPIYWIISTSLKPQIEWLAVPPVWIPSKIDWTNYLALFVGKSYAASPYGEESFTLLITPVQRAIIGSAICATGGTVLSVIVGLLAAFGISRHKIGGNFFPLFVLSARMMPPVCALIPIIVLYSTLRLADTYIGIILLYGLFTSPYSVWMIKSFIDEVPVQLEESAMVDGMSPLGAHFKVTLPLIKGGVLATALFVAVLNWSEFLFAFTLAQKNIITIPVQEMYFHAAYGVLYGPQSALGVIAIIPLMIFGYAIQRHLARGLTFGAVKR
jgi:multiple sugar transport system permease protein